MTEARLRRFAKPGMASVNTFWIETEDGLIVIDGRREFSSAREARARMEGEAGGKSIAAVFLPHPHPDHFGGPGVFSPEGSDIPMCASARTGAGVADGHRALVEASLEVVGEDFPDRVRLPARVLVDGQPIEIDGLTILPAEMRRARPRA